MKSVYNLEAVSTWKHDYHLENIINNLDLSLIRNNITISKCSFQMKESVSRLIVKFRSW